jgi:hypothetical protein
MFHGFPTGTPSAVSSRADYMGWPDLLVTDSMVMMAADDCRG